jgi:hypothetical protein
MWVEYLAATAGALCLAGSAMFARAASKRAAAAARSAEDAGRALRMIEGLLKAQAESGAQAAADTAKALEIATQSARAAQEGISAVHLLAEKSQRAYVTFDSLDVVHRDPAFGLPGLVRGEVRNGGRTPAASVVTCQWVRHLREWPAEPEYPGLETLSGAILGPGSGERVDASGPRLDAAAAQDVKRRKVTIFVYGISRYQDLLGAARQTRWAFYWNPDRQQFVRCPQHNDMT